VNTFPSPEVVIQRQLDAYNAHDLEAWLATYAEDAQQFELIAIYEVRDGRIQTASFVFSAVTLDG